MAKEKRDKWKWGFFIFLCLVLLFGIVLILLSSFVCAMAPTLANVDEYFTFDDSDYSAPTLTGLVGNYDLTNSGLATTGATGIYLQSWDYDGTNDYSTSTANTDVSNRKLSVNMWAKCDATSADSVLFNLGPQDDGIVLRYRIANLIELFEKIDGDFDSGTQAGTCDTSNFVMYTVTIDDTANEMKLYLNTVFQFTVTMDGLLSNIATPVLYIGNRPDGSGGNTNLWNGNIDEVSVYTDVLTTDEIDYLYNSGSPDAGQQYPFSATNSFKLTAQNTYNNSNISIYYALFNNSESQSIKDVTVASYLFDSNANNYVGDYIGDGDGTVSGATLNTTDGGYIFDGVNDYISINDNSYLNIGESLGSTGVWAFDVLYKTSPISKVIFRHGNTNPSIQAYFDSAGKLKVDIKLADTSTNFWTSVFLKPETRQRIVLYWNSTGLKLYVNGSFEKGVEVGQSLFSHVGNLWLGRTTSALNGTINNFQIFNSIPSGYTADTFALYLNNSPDIISKTMNTTNGAIYWDNNRLSNITVHNLTGTENVYYNESYSNYNTSVNLRSNHTQVILNLTAEDSNGNIIKNFNCSNEYFSSNTTNGTINNLEVNANITFSCDSGSYSTREHTTDSFLVSTDLETVIFINTSMDLNFFHENNNTPYIEEEITLSLVNEDFNQSFNYSTTSSHIIIHSIPNSFYTLAFGSNDTNKRFIHYYIPPDALTFKLDLYLLDMDLAKTVAYIVQDENAKVVSGAFINVSKFFIQNNSFMQTGYYETNVNGVVGIDKDDYSIYKEEIVYLNEIKATDTGPFIFAVSGTTKTFTIALEEDTTGELVDISKINFTISHSTTTGQFTFDWVDPLESINGVYINVLQNKILNPIINLSYSGSYGTETYNFNTTGSYTVVGFLNTSSGLVYTSGEALIIRSTPEQTNLQNMLFIIVIWVIASFILFLQIDWRLALTMSTMIVPYMFIKLGFLLMGMGSLFVNLIFIIIIIMITK